MNNKMYPCLWFEGNAKEAAEFYISVFGEGKTTVDTSMVVNFELSGQKFMGLNGGPEFKPTPSTSFMVVLEDKNELDKIYSQLADEGFVLMPLDKYDWSEKYSWVQDKFGISWQLMFGKLSDVHRQKFTPTLMFTQNQNGKAEEAMNFYMDLFPNSKSDGISKYQEGAMEGNVMHAQFSLNGHLWMAMDGGTGHDFTFSEGISNVIEANTQEEIDLYWNAFAKEGKESMCGWIQDKFGVWWQIFPSIVEETMVNPDKASKAMEAVMKMKKFDLEAYKKAIE
ncbi:VOC family protein [Moheibacter sediminis]|uniref:Glyoxalase superfamily enzyme, possibly 3-demethylubiquinone-9 3-methyltransferase n=1 Tax=Moheibacter sediminis TaxID=1434700 RepID=A0A1W2AGA9_9FLAO|nr:VOC family protein [Moheibacter sediminis]SMC59620.1 Glyoxalase superfamily enzyme, possibly 3-demethylubiquinone-9 3-methyltransferase [Moheibacter sediminis]